MDIAVEYLKQWYIIEIKLVHTGETPEEVKEEGCKQIGRYRDTVAPQAPAYLCIFDRRPETKLKPWEERITWTMDGAVRVVGC
jgi:hypothetical protein